MSGLELVNRDKNASHSLENFGVVLLVGSAVQIRDRTRDPVGEDFPKRVSQGHLSVVTSPGCLCV